jgi:CheY-like chemotaxis protein
MAKILVIEDNPTNLELIVYLLHAFGHTSLQAVDGETGLELIQRESVDLVLCDIHLPGVDGFEVAGQLKRDPRFSALPLVAVTALAMVGDRDRIISAGFNGYITKPISPETFVSELEAFLPAAGRTSSNRPKDSA